MRKLLTAILIILSPTVWADPIELLCSDCRDVYDQPIDFGNFAFNQVFGDTPFLSFKEGDKVIVWNTDGQWALVNLDFIVSQTSLSFSLLFISYDLRAPNGEIRIQVQDPRGTLTEYRVIASSPDLTVGEATPTVTPPLDTSTAEPSEPSESVEPEPVEPVISDEKEGGGGGTTDWGHEGAYYWYLDQSQFNLNVTTSE